MLVCIWIRSWSFYRCKSTAVLRYASDRGDHAFALRRLLAIFVRNKFCSSVKTTFNAQSQRRNVVQNRNHPKRCVLPAKFTAFMPAYIRCRYYKYLRETCKNIVIFPDDSIEFTFHVFFFFYMNHIFWKTKKSLRAIYTILLSCVYTCLQFYMISWVMYVRWIFARKLTINHFSNRNIYFWKRFCSNKFLFYFRTQWPVY